MDRLIELQIVPAQIEIRKTEAKIEYVNAKAQQQMSRNDGGMTIKTTPTKVNVDTYECRKSIGEAFMNVGDHIAEFANKGISKAQNSTAEYANRGQQQMKAGKGESLIQNFARQEAFKNVKMNIGIDFIPKVAPTVNVEKGSIEITHQPAELEFDWNITEQELHFTPGAVEVEMVQRPDVIVRYVGEPIYVPKSSAPGY